MDSRAWFAWAAVAAAVILSGIAAVIVLMPHPASTPTPASRLSRTAGARTSATPGLPTAAPTAATPVAGARPHVMVILEENRGFEATLGSCSADPYLCSLATHYASDTSWYGVSHPSAPNYVAIDSGSTQGIASDCTPDGGGCGPFSAPDLGAQLTGAGVPWVAYMESMPSACAQVSAAGAYAEKHDPFMYFSDNRGAACATHVLPYPGVGGMLSTLNGGGAPDLVWVTPNVHDDMHDGSVAQGDAWLQANLPAVLSSAWFADHGTVIITMDENDAASGSCCGDASGGHIPMVVISAKAQGRGEITSAGDHYGTLRSIEEVFGLALLGSASRAGNGDLSAMFG